MHNISTDAYMTLLYWYLLYYTAMQSSTLVQQKLSKYKNNS
jgi:hypothetical protein